jgi:hypothetical protein
MIAESHLSWKEISDAMKTILFITLVVLTLFAFVVPSAHAAQLGF